MLADGLGCPKRASHLLFFFWSPMGCTKKEDRSQTGLSQCLFEVPACLIYKRIAGAHVGLVVEGRGSIQGVINLFN